MKTVEFKFENGNKVKDIVTGYEGTIVSSHIFLNGCVRYSIQQGLDKDGKMPDEKWFDEGQLEKVDDGLSKKIEPKQTGGPVSSTPPKMR